jgi:Golgi phosphoprotein 3 (GPP34)
MTEDALIWKMFLILHDSFSGKTDVPPSLVRCGLVTAGLADLALHQRVAVESGRIVATDPQWFDRDDVEIFLLGSIRPQGSVITRTWMEGLGDSVYERVVSRLVADRVVRREERGGRLRRSTTDCFPAVDLLRAAGPRACLEHMLHSPHDMDLVGATLAGVIECLRLESVLDFNQDRVAVKQALAIATRGLPPDLRTLLDAVAAAVSQVTLTFRRL